MASRRQVLAGLAGSGSLVGCVSRGTTTGTVTRKSITVAVPQQTGDPHYVSVAFLAFEPDRRLVHGEYDPEHADAAVDEGALSASLSFHDALTEQFSDVRYTVNVVPADGTPANGIVDRAAFDSLSLGGTATVESYTGTEGWGRLRVHETTAPSRAPAEVTVDQFDLDERL